MSVVLQDCIMSGLCRVLADNVHIMGHTQDETVKRWQIVLELMSANNLKLSAKKTACFPTKLDLLGRTKYQILTDKIVWPKLLFFPHSNISDPTWEATGPSTCARITYCHIFSEKWKNL